MKSIFIICVLMSAFNLQQSPTETITVEVTNIKEASGFIRIGLYDRKDVFMKKSVQYHKVPVHQTGSCKINFENIPTGRYAISLYHDKNGNGKLDSNFMKIPKEPYGFSNNASGLFGPPSFEQASFEVQKEANLMLKIKL